MTVGAFLFKTLDREIIYLCRVSYSFAEMVYLSALRRMGSAVDFAEIRSRGGGGGSLDAESIA